MIKEHYDGLAILIQDVSPKERKIWLIKALTAALRWNITSTEKRIEDEHHAIVLTDLLNSIVDCN
jgi:hypothetical protein